MDLGEYMLYQKYCKETFLWNLNDLWQGTAWLLCNETTKLGKLTNFSVIFLVIGFISSYDII